MIPDHPLVEKVTEFLEFGGQRGLWKMEVRRGQAMKLTYLSEPSSPRGAIPGHQTLNFYPIVNGRLPIEHAQGLIVRVARACHVPLMWFDWVLRHLLVSLYLRCNGPHTSISSTEI